MLIKRKENWAEDFKDMHKKEKPHDGYEAIENFNHTNKQISETY